MTKGNPTNSDPNDPRNQIDPPIDEFRAKVLLARGVLTVDRIIEMIKNGDIIVPLPEPPPPPTWDFDEIEARATVTPWGPLSMKKYDPEGRCREAYLAKMNELLDAQQAARASGETPPPVGEAPAPVEETPAETPTPPPTGVPVVTEDLPLPPPTSG